MTTSEPTTGEMIAIMRGERDTQKSMPRVTLRMLVDRLESQEHQIKQLSEALAQGNEWHKESVEIATNNMLEYVRELSGIAGELERMTARAEKAEAREKRNLKWANIFRKIARKKYEEVLDWYYASKGF